MNMPKEMTFEEATMFGNKLNSLMDRYHITFNDNSKCYLVSYGLSRHFIPKPNVFKLVEESLNASGLEDKIVTINNRKHQKMQCVLHDGTMYMYNIQRPESIDDIPLQLGWYRIPSNPQ